MSQSTAEIHKLVDKDDEQFFPVTHIDAVIDDNGDALSTLLSYKQDTLVSGTSIKTVNSTSLLGSGDVSVGTYSKPSGGIPKTDLASAVQTSLGKADTALQSFTETDPVFSASAAAGISSSDITNWNGKTSNIGTITSVKMNGSTVSSSGEADLGTVITSHQDISGKADKVSSATNGNFAGLDTNGNLVDSGHKHSDYLTSFTETDPTVPSWAKEASKPSYTLDEVADGSTRKLSDYQPVDADLTAIAGLSGTSGLLKKTAANTWSLDTDTYYNSGNSNKSDVNWVCKNLIVNGEIGVGTTSPYPNVRLELVNSTSAAPDTTSIASTATIAVGRHNDDGLFFGFATYGWIQAAYYGKSGTTSATHTYSLILNPIGGNVGIGTSSPAEKLGVSGNIVASGTITPGSDTRIKDNQQEINPEDAISILEKLKPKTWTWNDKSNENLVGKSGAGLVAQDVKEVLPSAVSIFENGDIKDFHSLNYNTIQGYEIAAIKGLIEENKALKSEVAELKEKLNAIMEMLK